MRMQKFAIGRDNEVVANDFKVMLARVIEAGMVGSPSMGEITRDFWLKVGSDLEMSQSSHSSSEESDSNSE